jgi:acetylornithine/succinyldiaminopimelate/putrescine aminotransferase
MAMTAALIAARQMRDKNITMNVIERSRQLFNGLHELKQKHPVMGDIQGIGLMVSFSVGKAETVLKLQEKLKEHGVKSSLSTQDYIRFLPLTIINKEEVDYFLRQLDAALSELT